MRDVSSDYTPRTIARLMVFERFKLLARLMAENSSSPLTAEEWGEIIDRVKWRERFDAAKMLNKAAEVFFIKNVEDKKLPGAPPYSVIRFDRFMEFKDNMVESLDNRKYAQDVALSPKGE